MASIDDEPRLSETLIEHGQPVQEDEQISAELSLERKLDAICEIVMNKLYDVDGTTYKIKDNDLWEADGKNRYHLIIIIFF